MLDPSEDIYYTWLLVISIAVFYNYLFIIGRSTFELLQQWNPILWCILDYVCDLIYVLDIFVRLRTGSYGLFVLLFITMTLYIARSNSRKRNLTFF